jgi:hypothetical protein
MRIAIITYQIADRETSLIFRRAEPMVSWQVTKYKLAVANPHKKTGLLIIIIVSFLLPPLAAKATSEKPRGKPPHFLQAIVFESYLTPPPSAEKTYDVADLSSADFPVIFSQLFASFSRSQSVQLPPGVVLPKDLMFLDLFTFAVTEAQVLKNKRISHRNYLVNIEYNIRFLSWSNDRYKIVLDGRHEDLRFHDISFEVAADKTKLIRIRYSTNRTLFIALTPINYGNLPEGVTPPKPDLCPLPYYPSALSKAHPIGLVRMSVIIDAAGKIDRERFVLLECSHYLFARSSLDTILNKWTFNPATKNGFPVEARANIEVNFRVR